MAGLRRITAGVTLVAALAGTACTPDRPTPPSTPAANRDFRPGAEGAGDPYFPEYGNGGYDVAGYELDLRYDPKTDRLSGAATITATATADLSRFNFDLAHLTASSVTVDEAAAQHRDDGNELVITPAAGIPSGRQFTVRVDYAGVPKPLGDEQLGEGGFLHTDDGAIALGQPESASTWFPVNDHPSDKATFTLRIAVPEGLEAIGNGSPGPRATADGWTTWTWTERTPMVSYLATVVIGQYRVTSGTHRGKPFITAVPTSLPSGGAGARSIARTTEVADYLETVFGPYPVDAYGGVVVDDDRIRYALETQSRPVYGNAFFRTGPNTVVVAHEIAHQWFGDSVSMRQWKDIWLNEGFASYAEWLWQAHDGGPSVQESFDAEYEDFDWAVPPGDPGADNLFSAAVYKRGAMTVHAVRLAVGDEDFFRLLKGWTTQHRNANVATADFIAFAERVSGESLDELFDQWLFGTTRPEIPGR